MVQAIGRRTDDVTIIQGLFFLEEEGTVAMIFIGFFFSLNMAHSFFNCLVLSPKLLKQRALMSVKEKQNLASVFHSPSSSGTPLTN